MYEKLIAKTLTPIEDEYTILTFSDEEADDGRAERPCCEVG